MAPPNEQGHFNTADLESHLEPVQGLNGHCVSETHGQEIFIFYCRDHDSSFRPSDNGAIDCYDG
ncbi:MAG: hypothetical protein CXT66_05145 [Methanobacteriota archaeon]|nr:MAG: hypothetical protein CXT66_05145 [Euryarchaeota archaeon]